MERCGWCLQLIQLFLHFSFPLLSHTTNLSSFVFTGMSPSGDVIGRWIQTQISSMFEEIFIRTTGRAENFRSESSHITHYTRTFIWLSTLTKPDWTDLLQLAPISCHTQIIFMIGSILIHRDGLISDYYHHHLGLIANKLIFQNVRLSLNCWTVLHCGWHGIPKFTVFTWINNLLLNAH